MLSGLPDRPLYRPEIEAFTDSDAIRFAFPATPESIEDDEEGRTRIHDVLLFLEKSVAVVAYVGEGDGWTVVANESGDEPYETAINVLIDYRGYEIEEEGAMREIVREFYGVTEEFLNENEPE
jgi:hypothetical protein